MFGERVGRYRVLRELGRGGMAQVYVGLDETLGRHVAIKVLAAELAARPEMIERFSREARVIASIRHPGIVEIYDVGVEPRPYIVMELLRGESLEKSLRTHGPFTERILLGIAGRIAEALGAAHRQGVVHRDLKPGNVFLVSDPTATVKVLDFGIAKLTGEAADFITHGGTLVGTPVYMSPEQCRGAQNIDERSDLYSLGCVMFQMAAGRPPFEERGHALLLAHISQEPPSLRSLVPDASSGFADVVHKLLAKNPDDRFASVDALLGAMDVVAGTSVSSLPIWTPEAPALVAPGATDEAGQRPEPLGRAASSRAPFDEAGGPTTGASFGPSQPVSGLGPPTFYPPARPLEEATTAVIEYRPDVVVDPVSKLAGGLPESMRGMAELVWAFLSPVFGGVERLTPGLFVLENLRWEAAASYRYFALVMEASRGAPVSSPSAMTGGRLGTRTFVEHAAPLEERLAALPAEQKKVVVVVVDSLELGRGVREKLLEYRARYEAIVVPVYLAELSRAQRLGTLERLFRDRLADLHTPPDPFTSRSPATAPLRFFGMRPMLNQLLADLKSRSGLIVIGGSPGSGKTSVIDMAEHELPGADFCRFRCAGHVELPRIVQGLIRCLDRVRASDLQVSSSGLGSSLESALARTAAHGHELVVVLEDADWLVEQLEAASLDDGERAAAREIWTELGRYSDRGLRLMVTGLRGFRLRSRIVAGWENPVAADVLVLLVPRLSAHEVAHMVQELGAEANLRFSHEALAAVAHWSGGHVDLVRRLCSEALRARRATASPHPLAVLDFDEDDVRRAAQEMVLVATTFAGSHMTVLDSVERCVLRIVAGIHPTSVEPIKARMRSGAKDDEVVEALESLRQMGLVERRNGRERVTIPLLEDWVLRHLDDPGQAWLRDRRLRLAVLGLLGTALLAGVYVTFIRSGLTAAGLTDTADQCRYTLYHPMRASGGEPLHFRLRRDCEAQARPVCPTLSTKRGTSARLGTHLDRATPEELCGGNPDAEWSYQITVQDLTTIGSAYEFELKAPSASRPGEYTVQHFAVVKDELARIKGLVDGAFQVAAALPALLGVFAALFRDTQKILRGLVQPTGKRPSMSG